MQFKVPQFIDIEDKIFGPLTFKEFVYIAGGGALCYVLYVLLPLFLAIVVIIPVAGLSLALAFYKMNGKPFIFTLEAFFRYVTQKKLYLWKKESVQNTPKNKEVKNKEEEASAPTLTEGKLKDIAWSLDILDIKKEREGNTKK